MSHSLSAALELALSARDHPDGASFRSACALSARRERGTPLSRALRAIATGLEADELDRGEPDDDELGLHSTVWSVVLARVAKLPAPADCSASQRAAAARNVIPCPGAYLNLQKAPGRSQLRRQRWWPCVTVPCRELWTTLRDHVGRRKMA